MIVELLTLKNHFIVIDSPVDFQLVANPVLINNNGVYSFPDGRVKGTDVCSRRAGAWQIDAWKLLGKRDFPLRPAFTMCLVYDESGLFSDESVSIQYSDINVGEGIAGVNGQLVTIDARDFTPVIDAIENIGAKISGFGLPFVPTKIIEGFSTSEDFPVGSTWVGRVSFSVLPFGLYYAPSGCFINNRDGGESISVLGGAYISHNYAHFAMVGDVVIVGTCVKCPSGRWFPFGSSEFASVVSENYRLSDIAGALLRLA